jgi:hypothetical protein
MGRELMTNLSKPDLGGDAIVTLGADVGGRDAHDATNEPVLALRRRLQAACSTPYSEVLGKIHLLLQIDGSIQSWGKTGVDRVFIRPALGYASADIFVPSVEWHSPARFRAFLARSIREAVDKVGERAVQRKQPLALERLAQDVESALQSFLGETA